MTENIPPEAAAGPRSDEVEVFLASRFDEFRAVRAALTGLFSAARDRGEPLSLLDYDSDARGKPEILSFCLEEVREAPVFVLLLGLTYPEEGTGTGNAGRMITHDEYLEAVAVAPGAKEILVFLIGERYRDVGTAMETEHPRLRELLDTIAHEAWRPGHQIHVVADGTPPEIAAHIHLTVAKAVASRTRPLPATGAHRPIRRRLMRLLMRGGAGDRLELAPALERIAGANRLARMTFEGRKVPARPFHRKLFRMNDCSRPVYDFEAKLRDDAPGKVLGIVSPSGQGKSTFIAGFAAQFGLSEHQYLILTGRELTRETVDEQLASVVSVVKGGAAFPPSAGPAAPHFYVLVDALNECSRTDSLLKHLILWLETLLHFAARSGWPLTVLLTMRPDVAKMVPEETQKLVLPANTYDLQGFGRREYRKTALAYRLSTGYDSLRRPARALLSDPFMLTLTAQEFEGGAVPEVNTGSRLLQRYVDRLATPGGSDDPDPSVLRDAQAFAEQLLDRHVQVLGAHDAEVLVGKAGLQALMSSGLLTDLPEGAESRRSKCCGFRFDRVAELLMGRGVERRLREMGDAGLAPLAIQRVLADDSGLAEMHWSGMAQGLLFHLQAHPLIAGPALIALMTERNARWRMLARSALLRLQRDDRAMDGTMYDKAVELLVGHADRHRGQREFRAELMRAAFELIREDEDLKGRKVPRSLGRLLSTLCVGLNSRDQELADLAITSLSSLITRGHLVGDLQRHVLEQIERMDMSASMILGKQLAARTAAWWRERRAEGAGRRPLVVPVNTAVKLMIVCFAASPDEAGHAACVSLLAALLRRFRTTTIGRIAGTSLGRRCMLLVLGAMLEAVLRRNMMPINKAEWQRMVGDAEQFQAFKDTMRLVDPGRLEFDPEAIVATFRGGAPNPFVYQTIVTSLSTKYELAPASRDKVLATVRALVEADAGDGIAKYVASLVLYHINTFGDHGTAQTADMMTSLAADMMEHHDGMFGAHEGAKYNSNVIGTAGRSLIHLADRKELSGDDAFRFIRDQMAKVKTDPTGAFTKYLLGNLALLAVLLPENRQLMRLLKEEVYQTRAAAAPADFHTEEWLIEAFVRIRAAHPAAVDEFLLRRDDDHLYLMVREQHASSILQGDALGLDAEIVSWAFERIVFDILTKATGLASRANRRWCDGMDRSPRLRASCLVDLGLICFEEAVAWAERYRSPAADAPVLANSAMTP